MSGQAQLYVAQVDRQNPHLREFVTTAVAANKAKRDAHKFLTYVPLHGPRDLAYVWFPTESFTHLEKANAAAPLAAHVGDSQAISLASHARTGVKALGGELLHCVARSGGSGPTNYVLAVGVRIKPGQRDTFLKAGRAVIDANKKHSNPVRFGVFMPVSGLGNLALVLLGFDSLAALDVDGHLNTPRLAQALGDDAAITVGKELAGSVDAVWKQPLRYVPTLSNA